MESLGLVLGRTHWSAASNVIKLSNIWITVTVNDNIKITTNLEYKPAIATVQWTI